MDQANLPLAIAEFPALRSTFSASSCILFVAATLVAILSQSTPSALLVRADEVIE